MVNNQRGFAHVLVVAVLLVGLVASVYLVQQRTNFFPHAESRPISEPITPTPTPPSFSACTVDIDKDGKVTLNDFERVRSCFGKASTDKDNAGNSCALADFNKDGYVTILDFSILRTVFGQECLAPTIAPTSTPTPTPLPKSLPTSVPDKPSSKIPASLACTPCQADLNNDGSVSITDFTKISSCYNKTVSVDCSVADINKDDKIDSSDLSCLMAQFGKKCSR